MPIRFVLDCDTGSDDAIAILAAASHPELEAVAITTVGGNVALEHVTANTLSVLDLVGAAVPVYAGADRPFLRPDLPIPRDVLNKDGEFQLARLGFPEPVSTARAENAVDFLTAFFLDDANADVTLVATGPLTNLAVAVTAEPRLAGRIPRLVVMGGAHANGNVTAAAEFNFWADPEAAEVVLSAGIPEVVIVPLDATHSAPLTERDCAEFDAIGSPAAAGAAMLLRHRLAHDQAAAVTASSPVHDPMCVAYLVRPDLFTESVRAFASVETTGDRTVGELLVDTRPWCPEPPNATVALRASVEVYREFLRTAFEAADRDAPRKSA
ncbi:nucleoside hydrolase [Glycomyces harbinensis]|uniref:Purine nucleosidase/pyrimidine-specific ribonucleoside hydrolase n=1 Tax=Glycomyces harbinensis TaxID=58114 RepID=A0A1G6ZTV3_9ACTN|nr:nucleoside hydrolase [Glycomyces harbinensis]SDE05275.1 purine nucleosidase/pyrimidine-specific ribonucleoside hydrolase [Glycomyces harbinensis]